MRVIGETVLRTNLTSAFLVSRAVARRLMIKRRSGSIVNVSSVVGKPATAGRPTTALRRPASSHGFTKSLAREGGLSRSTRQRPRPGLHRGPR